MDPCVCVSVSRKKERKKKAAVKKIKNRTEYKRL